MGVGRELANSKPGNTFLIARPIRCEKRGALPIVPVFFTRKTFSD